MIHCHVSFVYSITIQNTYVIPKRTAKNPISAVYGGSERIRTSETLTGLPDFKSGPIDHSGTLP